MTKVVVLRDIEPVDGRSCNARCVWRDGIECDLFLTALVPVSSNPFETRCLRSSECVASERRGVEWERKKSKQKPVSRMPKVVG